MKQFLAALLVVCSFSLAASAGTKVCFYVSGNLGGEKGDFFIANVKNTSLAVSKVKGEGAWEGLFPRTGKDVKGKDGNTYFSYYDNEGSDGCNFMIADSSLVRQESTGYIKFRCGGEGFGESKFFCRDSNY